MFLLSTGCTHSLYQAELDVRNSEGEPRKTILYWSKTGTFIGDAKAGPIVLRTACSTRALNFEDSESGIVFRGTPGQARIPGQGENIAEGAICGKVDVASRITDLGSGPMLLTIQCEAVTDEFSIRQGLFLPAYIQAREEPYRFNVQEKNSWSLLGKTPGAPSPPECP